MNFFSKKAGGPSALPIEKSSESSTPSNQTPASRSVASLNNDEQERHVVAPATLENEPKLTVLAVLLGAIASMGGFIFGYESGQISGVSLPFLAHSGRKYYPDK